jgi:hypothetical protein
MVSTKSLARSQIATRRILGEVVSVEHKELCVGKESGEQEVGMAKHQRPLTSVQERRCEPTEEAT